MKSVTQIIKESLPSYSEDIPPFILERAAERGKKIHESLASYCQTEIDTGECEIYLLKQWLNKQVIPLSSVICESEFIRDGVIGHPDAYAPLQISQIALWDTKTTYKLMDTTALQLVAYEWLIGLSGISLFAHHYTELGLMVWRVREERKTELLALWLRLVKHRNDPFTLDDDREEWERIKNKGLWELEGEYYPPLTVTSNELAQAVCRELDVLEAFKPVEDRIKLFKHNLKRFALEILGLKDGDSFEVGGYVLTVTTKKGYEVKAFKVEPSTSIKIKRG